MQATLLVCFCSCKTPLYIVLVMWACCRLSIISVMIWAIFIYYSIHQIYISALPVVSADANLALMYFAGASTIYQPRMFTF